MAAPFFSTPLQRYVYQSPEDAVVAFQILGGEAQIVQIMMKPGESIIAKPGCMGYMSASVEMEKVHLPENEAGLWQMIFGKTVTSIVFRNTGPTDGFVGIPAPSVARIIPMDLAIFGEVLCQPDAFLCSVNDVKITNTVDPRARNAPASAEGFLRQKLSGQGLAFVIAGGSVAQKVLEVDEVLTIDVACIAAITTTIGIKINNNTPTRKTVFGGENQVFATLKGPGIVFIQSLPYHRFSQRVVKTVAYSNLRDNMQIALFMFVTYVILISWLILTDLV